MWLQRNTQGPSNPSPGSAQYYPQESQCVLECLSDVSWTLSSLVPWLCNLFLCPTIFWVKNLFQRSRFNLPWLIFMIFPQVLLLVTREQRSVLIYIGLIQRKSCLTNLIAFYNVVVRRVDKGRAGDIFCLDFSKDFDNVSSHNILIGRITSS